MLHIVQSINAYLSDWILTILLTGTGLYFSIHTRFVQVRCFGEGLRRVFRNFSLHGGQHKGGMSTFQALATAVAAQMGTGNIVGASSAILIGGPGAIFWMWIAAFQGMAISYAEAILAQKTRVSAADGTVSGGPVYYIRQAFPNGLGRLLAGFFAIAAVFSLGFVGGMLQANSIGETCAAAFGIPSWLAGGVIAVIVGVIFLKGVARLASVVEKIVPLMAVLYLLCGMVLLCWRIRYIPETFGMIFKYAFHPEAIIGGGLGHALKTAISMGIKRGLFSNEAGMGSTPHAHALAQVERPHDQGVMAMFGVFLDTFVVLTMSGLIVVSAMYAGNGPLTAGAAAIQANGITSTNLIPKAFAGLFGDSAAGILVAICLLFLAFTTILGWGLFGKINFQYLFGKRFLWLYTMLLVVFVFLGSVLSNSLLWELQDMCGQLLVIPNILALFVLSPLVKAASCRNGK